MVLGYALTVQNNIVVLGSPYRDPIRRQLALFQQRISHKYTKVGHILSATGAAMGSRYLVSVARGPVHQD
jgi:hypothetical protein